MDLCTHTPTHAHTHPHPHTHTIITGLPNLKDLLWISQILLTSPRSHSHVEAILPMLYIVHIIYDLLQVDHQQCMAVHGVVLMNKI